MPTPHQSTTKVEPHHVVKHGAVLRKHWLIAVLIFILGPLLGFLIAADRGLMLGLAVGVLSIFWRWWEGKPQSNDSVKSNSSE